MNQRELGEKLGVGQTTVSAWETGKNEPDSAAMNTMAQLFGVSIGYLAGYENNEMTRGLSQEQIMQRIEERDFEREIEHWRKAEEAERRGFTDEEVAEMIHQELLEEWDRIDPNHLMYLETFQINQMCDELGAKDRQRILKAAQAVYEAAKDR